MATSRCWAGASTDFSRLRLFRWTCGLKAAGEETGNQTRTCWTEQVETEATTVQSSHQAGGPELFSTCSPHPAFSHSLESPSTSLSLFLTFCLSSLLYFPLSLSPLFLCSLPFSESTCHHSSLLSSLFAYFCSVLHSLPPTLILSFFLSYSCHFSSALSIFLFLSDHDDFSLSAVMLLPFSGSSTAHPHPHPHPQHSQPPSVRVGPSVSLAPLWCCIC